MSNFWESAPLAGQQSQQPQNNQTPQAAPSGNFWESAPVEQTAPSQVQTASSAPTQDELRRAADAQAFQRELDRVNREDMARRAANDTFANPAPTAFDKAEAAYQGAQRGIAPAVGGLFGSGVSLGALGGLVARIPNPIARLAGTALVAGAGGIAGSVGTNAIQDKLAPLDERERQLATNPETAPYFQAGAYIPGAATLTYGLGNVKGLYQGAQAIRSGAPLPPQAVEAAVNVGTNIPLALGANYVGNQGEINTNQAIGDALLGVFGQRPNIAGMVPFATGYGLTSTGINAARRGYNNAFPRATRSETPVDLEVVPDSPAVVAPDQMPPGFDPAVWAKLTPEGKAMAIADWMARQAQPPAPEIAPTPEPQAQAPEPAPAQLPQSPATPQAEAPTPEPQRPATVKPHDWDGLNLETKRLLAEEARINAEEQAQAQAPAPKPQAEAPAQETQPVQPAPQPQNPASVKPPAPEIQANEPYQPQEIISTDEKGTKSGRAVYYATEDEGIYNLDLVEVNKEKRGQGIGTDLMSRALREIKSKPGQSDQDDGHKIVVMNVTNNDLIPVRIAEKLLGKNNVEFVGGDKGMVEYNLHLRDDAPIFSKIASPSPSPAPQPPADAPAPAPRQTPQPSAEDIPLTRIGGQDEGGNYYGVEGQTQYEGGERYVLPKGSKVADLRDAGTADALINEALKDPNLTPDQRATLEEAIGQGDIDYTIFDETPMADAARRLGYDAVRVVENQDMPGTASSVFVLNNQALRKPGSTQATRPVQTEIAGAQDAFNLTPEETRAPVQPKPAEATVDALPDTQEPAYVSEARRDLADLEAQGKGNTAKAKAIKNVIDEYIERKNNPNIDYRGGEKIEFNGKTQQIHGGTFYEFVYLTGPKKGQVGVTQTPPRNAKPATVQKPTPETKPADVGPARPDTTAEEREISRLEDMKRGAENQLSNLEKAGKGSGKQAGKLRKTIEKLRQDIAELNGNIREKQMTWYGKELVDAVEQTDRQRKLTIQSEKGSAVRDKDGNYVLDTYGRKETYTPEQYAEMLRKQIESPYTTPQLRAFLRRELGRVSETTTTGLKEVTSQNTDESDISYPRMGDLTEITDDSQINELTPEDVAPGGKEDSSEMDWPTPEQRSKGEVDAAGNRTSPGTMWKIEPPIEVGGEARPAGSRELPAKPAAKNVIYRGTGKNLNYSGIDGVTWYARTKEIAGRYGDVSEFTIDDDANVLTLHDFGMDGGSADYVDVNNAGARKLIEIAKKHGINLTIDEINGPSGEELFSSNDPIGRSLIKALKAEGVDVVHTSNIEGEATFVINNDKVKPSQAKPAAAVAIESSGLRFARRRKAEIEKRLDELLKSGSGEDDPRVQAARRNIKAFNKRIKAEEKKQMQSSKPRDIDAEIEAKKKQIKQKENQLTRALEVEEMKGWDAAGGDDGADAALRLATAQADKRRKELDALKKDLKNLEAEAAAQKPTESPVNRRAEGAKKAWETRRQRGERDSKFYGRPFDEEFKTPDDLRRPEPQDIRDARAQIVADAAKGRRPNRELVAKIDQYTDDRLIELGDFDGVTRASDDALTEYIDRVTNAEKNGGADDIPLPTEKELANRELAVKELERRQNNQALEEGEGTTDSTNRSVISGLRAAVRATGEKLPLYPPEFGDNEWSSVYESLPEDVRDEVFNDFRGQLDLKRMRDPALGPSYRAEIRAKAEKAAESVFTQMAGEGLADFDLGKNSVDVGVNRLRDAGANMGEETVGPIPRKYKPDLPEAEAPFGFALIPGSSLTPVGVSMMDIAQAGATVVLADPRVLPGLNPIASNMHLLAEGRQIGAIFAGKGQRFVQSPAMKEVAEMFAIRGGNDAKGAKETFYDERDAQRRILTGKLTKAFDPVAQQLETMGKADIEAMDQRLAKMLSGEEGYDPASPEGKVVDAIKNLAEEARKYAENAGLNIPKVEEYGMPHSVNVAKVDADQAGFLAAATRAYAINNPRRIAANRKRLEVLNKTGRGNTDEAVQLNLEIADLTVAKPAEQAKAWLENILMGAEGADHTMGLMLEGSASTNSADFLKSRTFFPEARAVLRQYYNNDPRLAWKGYIDRVTTMAEFARRFGAKGEKWLAMVDQMRAEGASELQIQMFRDHVKDALGTLNPHPSPGHALANALLGLSNMAKLKSTAIANFLEPMAAATRGDLTSAVTAPLMMLKNTVKLLAEMNPAERQRFLDELGRAVENEDDDIALARAVGLIDAAGATDILANSGHTIDSANEYKGGGAAMAAARRTNEATGAIARAYGLEVTENAKRATTARLAVNRIDGFVDGLKNDSILARAYDVARPGNTDNPFSIRAESRMRLRRIGIPDDQMDAFVDEWIAARKSGKFMSWLMSNPAAMRAVRMEASQSMVNSNRAFNTGGEKGKWISQDQFLGKAMMTFLRYPAAAMEQIFRPMFKDVKMGVSGRDEDLEFSNYSRARMIAQALAVPAMMMATAAYLYLRDRINKFDDKSDLQRVVEAYSYTGASGGKAEAVNKLMRGEIPPVLSEIFKTMQNIARAERGEGKRVLVNDAIKYAGQPTAQGLAAMALPAPLNVLATRLIGSKEVREEIVDETMGKKKKPGAR